MRVEARARCPECPLGHVGLITSESGYTKCDSPLCPCHSPAGLWLSSGSMIEVLSWAKGHLDLGHNPVVETRKVTEWEVLDLSETTPESAPDKGVQV